MLSVLFLTAVSSYAQGDILKGFANPPQEYRPQVWWHWMNGNISREGLDRDLDWMERMGISGFHIFDAGFDTPQIVPERVPYMTPEWKKLFNHVLDRASGNGMQVAITSSPGWSITGGPWVSREDAMKKLVWSETVVSEGDATVMLAAPDSICGPYLNCRRYSKDPHRYDYYKDIAVLAVRMRPEDMSMQEMGAKLSTSDGADPSSLLDGIYDNTLTVSRGSADFAWVQVEFSDPRTIRSVMASVDYKDRGNYARRIECSDDGVHFRTIVPRAPETTTSIKIYDIPPTRAKYFRFCSNNADKPLNYAELALYGVSKVNAATEKSGFYAFYSTRDFYPTPECNDALNSEDIIDVTAFHNNGRLEWKVPAGRWKIYRMGYSLTGKQNGPASPEATGLEVDKLNRDAVLRYYRNYLSMYQEASSDRLGKAIRNLMIDSYESGCQNWTADMPAQFRSRRGYELLPWLPALAGELIGSAEQTERFLFDWRQTLEELMAECHYDAVDAIKGEYGLSRYTEAQEYNRVYNADGMDVRRHADVPMAAFWMREFYSSYPCEEADMHEAASVAHIYGQNVVAGESFTTNGLDPDCYGQRVAWRLCPANLKPAADAAMASGQNRFVIHSVVHQPVEDKVPGLTLSRHGSAFNRHNTWAEEARPWVDYLSRSSYLLSQGRNVADVAVFYSETTNAVARFKLERPEVPDGFNYDFINKTALKEAVTPDMYRIIVIDKEVKGMTVPVLRRFREFADAGVLLVGEAPSSCLSLMDDEKEFDSLVRDIWHSGRFNVISQAQLPSALRGMGITKDADIPNPHGVDMRFVHRKLDEGELYWVANIDPAPRKLECSFRVAGRKPFVLDPVTGRSYEPSWRLDNGRTVVNLDMVQNDALFVVFTEKTEGESHIVSETELRAENVLAGPWKLSFQQGRGAPASAVLADLQPLSESEDPGIRYFSGTVSYCKDFRYSGAEDARQVLDLGRVCDMAHVYLNGKDLGLLWKAPYTVDVTDALVKGKNHLEIRVTNTWHNRIIGDLRSDSGEQITYTTYPFYTADSPLIPSGLLGPVVLISQFLVL